MTDNELFNHFKTHSVAFDEMPGENLWSKIESGLDNTRSTGKSNLLLFTVCGILLTALIVWYFATPESTAKISPTVKPVTIKTSGLKNNTIRKPQINTLHSASADAEKRAPTQTAIIVKNAAYVDDVVQDSVKKVKVRTAKIKPVSTTEKTATEPYVKFMSYTKGTIAPLEDSPTFEVQKKETFGNIIITTKQKITNAEYNQLIADMLNEHEKSIGALLTIKAPGHKPFRVVIGLNKTETLQAISVKDSLVVKAMQLNTVLPILGPGKPTLKIPKLNPDTISFKNRATKDSITDTKERISE